MRCFRLSGFARRVDYFFDTPLSQLMENGCAWDVCEESCWRRREEASLDSLSECSALEIGGGTLPSGSFRYENEVEHSSLLEGKGEKSRRSGAWARLTELIELDPLGTLP